jgi:hypothetical protein
MFSLASRIRRPFQRLPRLAIAGITAILLGLPSAAGATFLHPPDTSWGGSSSPRDLSLTFRDFHSEFVERAARDFDGYSPRLPALADILEHNRFRGTHGGGATFDGLTQYGWIEEALSRGHHRIADALRLRHFCAIDPPPEVPEPGTALLLAGGLAGLSFVGRKRRAGRAAQGVS